ncbi:hypothetical protein GIB67_010763 [Kingdonia uniflora]|uniref:PPM-type phosphatase domain-containing protein n=1 Tax=Kingdonia uniflora TaxID=39325 RepID=A0A7J7L8S1_9MAGN|nr:hypothetical protein GIB67_010763 [Kingdonia uniflora]
MVGKYLYVTNVGDSRAVISKAGQAIPLSEDHNKPNKSEEQKRIESVDGVVIWVGTWRVDGVLAKSRAFASVKQALVEEAAKLSGPNILESYEILKRYCPRASIFPSVLDYTYHPYSLPFSRQPLYADAISVMFNATILNGMGLIGYVEGQPTWHPNNDEGNLLSIYFSLLQDHLALDWLPRTAYANQG